MHAAVLKAVRVSAHVRSHVICLKCPKRLIALVFDDVDLPYCTSKVGLADYCWVYGVIHFTSPAG